MDSRNVLRALTVAIAGLPWLTGSAQATVVERVVAVVGEQAILLSDVRDRAQPFLIRIEQQVPPGAQRAAAMSELYGQLLNRMVDEKLEEGAANRAHINVTAREVDDALQRIAAQNNVTVEIVIEEARKSGLSERQYRQEIRRQLLEAKLLNLRVQGRLRVSESDLEAAYNKLVQQERRSLGFRPAWIRVAAPRSLSADGLEERRALADRIVADARNGASFDSLLRRYGMVRVVRGGVLGRMKPGQFPPTLDALARGLEVGEVSEPLRYGDDLVILQVVERDPSKLPSFQEAQADLSQQVYVEKMDKARRQWLDSLRKQFHVDVRL